MPGIFVFFLPIVSVVLGLVVSASLLQLDSPTRANAFWASRPLSPTAVLGSKLVVVMVVIVGLPLIGAAIGLGSLSTSSIVTTRLVTRCAIGYAGCALGVLVLGALTDDLRGAVVAFIGILFGTMIVGIAVASFVSARSGPMFPVFLAMALGSSTVVAAGGSITLLAFLYRTRARRVSSWIAGALATSWLIIGSTCPMVPSATALPRVGSKALLVVQPNDTGAWRDAARRLDIRLTPSAGFPTRDERTDFQADSVTIQLLDGKRVNVARFGFDRTTLTYEPPPLGTTVRWPDGVGYVPRGHLTLEPQADVREEIGKNAKSVSVAGTATSLRSRPIVSLPLRTGESVTRDGRRIAIYGFSHDATTVDVWVQLSTVPRDPVPAALGDPTTIDDLRFVIVNDTRSEAFLLQSKHGGGGSGGLVLPWIQIQTRFHQLTSELPGRERNDLILDDAWFNGARLVVLEWSVVRRFPARGETALR
jgi:hypothetical protein